MLEHYVENCVFYMTPPPVLPTTSKASYSANEFHSESKLAKLKNNFSSMCVRLFVIHKLSKIAIALW